MSFNAERIERRREKRVLDAIVKHHLSVESRLVTGKGWHVIVYGVDDNGINNNTGCFTGVTVVEAVEALLESLEKK